MIPLDDIVTDLKRSGEVRIICQKAAVKLPDEELLREYDLRHRHGVEAKSIRKEVLRRMGKARK